MKTYRLIAIIFLPIFFAGFSFAQDSLKLHFINVKEAEAFLIQAEDGNVLIDTGSLLSGYSLAGYLRKNGVSKIKYLIITHPHPDHASGIFFILPKFQIERICDNGQALNEDNDIERWYRILVRENKNYRVLKKGDKLKLQDISLDVFWPAEPDSASYNENSLVIKLAFKNNFSCLFTGDIDSKVENELLKEGLDLKADILKVSHHGYKDATSQEFLDAVLPEAAIISAGPKDKLGPPSPSVLGLLNKRNIKIYRTDIDGSIVVTIDAGGHYSIKGWKKIGRGGK